MIYGIGTDICDIRRIRASLERHGERFAGKILCDAELLAWRARSAPGVSIQCVIRTLCGCRRLAHALSSSASRTGACRYRWSWRLRAGGFLIPVLLLLAGYMLWKGMTS